MDYFKISVLIFCTLFIFSCKQNQSDKPILTIIKYNSSIAMRDYEEAEKYIDLASVFKEINLKDGLSIKDYWVNQSEILNNIVISSKKFTSCFKYHNYKIIQDFESDKRVKISFYPIIKSNMTITYLLESDDGNWKIVKKLQAKSSRSLE